jgi:hypothetical protein
MSVISSQFAQRFTPTVMSEFATECGLVLARSGDQVLDALMEIANENADSLRA